MFVSFLSKTKMEILVHNSHAQLTFIDTEIYYHLAKYEREEHSAKKIQVALERKNTLAAAVAAVAI